MSELQKSLRKGAPEFKEPRRRNRRVLLPLSESKDLASIAQELRPYLRGEKFVRADGAEVRLDAAILIPANLDEQILRPDSKTAVPERPGIQYWSGNLADKSLRNLVETAVNREIRSREAIK